MILATTGGLNSFVQLLTVFILFLFVLVLTYYVTRWISGFQKTQMTGCNMEIIDTMRIAQNKYLQMIRTGDKYFVIAVCKDTVTMLTEVSKDSISLEQSLSQQNLSFKEILKKVKDNVDEHRGMKDTK